MPRTAFAGTGFYVPERVVTNDELAQYMDTSNEWIVERTGIEERRWVEPDETTTSDLGLAAAEKAMAAAGIPPGAPVMLVGHSQGGMAAAHLAADPDFQGGYDVQHVVTAGSPTAQVPHVPSNTQLLSLENSGDLVPLTDGEDNPDEPNRTTVVFDGRTGSIGENHSMDTYAAGGAAVDASDDPSINHELDALREDGFLGSDDPASTQSYTIVREP